MNKSFGQITRKDCWISASVIAIYIALGKIPGMKIRDDKVYLRDKIIKLVSTPDSELEGAIRALRVYFTEECNYQQRNMTLENLEKYGSPDFISELLVQKRFTKYCLNKFCYSRLFYYYLSLDNMKKMISLKRVTDVILCTFDFNVSHLYIILNLDEDDNMLVIDVSTPNLMINKFRCDQVYILMKLELSLSRLIFDMA